MQAVRTGTIAREMTPVFLGSAYKNKAVQPLLNAVISYLPSPLDIENEAIDIDNNEETVILESKFDKPTVALAFKLEDGQYGQLTYIRVYQGCINKGDTLINSRDGKKIKAGRLIRMHSAQMEEVEAIPAGHIGAMFGIDCASVSIVLPVIHLSPPKSTMPCLPCMSWSLLSPFLLYQRITKLRSICPKL